MPGARARSDRVGNPLRLHVGAEGAVVDDDSATGSFDVLHGLVIAVDTKDRYTKRHSEDVARYVGELLAGA